MNQNCVVTTANYRVLHKAFVMVESVFEHNPDCDIIIFVPDMSHEKIANVRWPVSPSVRIIGLDDIRHPALQKMHLYFSAFELGAATKAFLLEHVISTESYSKVVMLDSDIVCYDSLDFVWSELENKDMALIPHVNSPQPQDGYLPDDREITNVGFINAGFWAVAKTDGALKILHWIMDKVAHYGFYIPRIKLNAEQTWMSCLPWFFPDTTVIIRHPGMNVAYWNLHERQLSKKDGRYFCNGEKLVFLHYSGYDLNNPERLTIHTNRRFDHNTERILSELVKDYGNMLTSAIKSLPLLEPDLPCSDLPLESRIRMYQNVYGEKVRFANEQERVSLIKRVCGKLKKAVNLLIRLIPFKRWMN